MLLLLTASVPCCNRSLCATRFLGHLAEQHLLLQLNNLPAQRALCQLEPSAHAAGINSLLAQQPLPAGHFDTWLSSIMEIKERFPMWYPKRDDVIVPQWAIEVRACDTPSREDAIVFLGQ